MKEGYAPASKAAGMKAMAGTFGSPSLFKVAGKVGRWFLKYAPFSVNNRLNPWYKHREMPKPPSESFSEWYSRNKKINSKKDNK